jgi:hypothetical protein
MMARRRLLTGERWTKFLTTPIDERELIRHYTLGRDDLDIIATKRTARNRRKRSANAVQAGVCSGGITQGSRAA